MVAFKMQIQYRILSQKYYTEGNEAHVLPNESFNSLADLVNFMSKKFDVLSKQLQELILSMKDLREENKILKEQNNYLRNEFILLFRKVNNLEQKSLDKFVEIVDVPTINNEDRKLIVNKNCYSFKCRIRCCKCF